MIYHRPRGNLRYVLAYEVLGKTRVTNPLRRHSRCNTGRNEIFLNKYFRIVILVSSKALQIYIIYIFLKIYDISSNLISRSSEDLTIK